MPVHCGNHSLINSFRDSVYGELRKGDRLTVTPPWQTGAKEKMPTYVFELTGFNPTTPEVAQAKVTIDGKDAGTKRIDFERFGDFFNTDRTIYLTDDARYGALPVYLQRLGSDYTEVV